MSKTKYLAAKKAAEIANKLPESNYDTPYMIRKLKSKKTVKNRKYKSNRTVNKLRRELYEAGEIRYL